MRQLSNLVVLVLIVGGAYALWNWKFAGQGDEVAAFAERSCIDAIRGRFDASGVRANSVRPNRNGYVVRGTMTLPRGDVAKVTCLTNVNGSVQDMFVEER